jgi:hypothetical protein
LEVTVKLNRVKMDRGEGKGLYNSGITCILGVNYGIWMWEWVEVNLLEVKIGGLVGNVGT